MYKIGALFGENLKRLRKSRGLTQGELAEHLNRSLRAVQSYETNNDRLPNTDIIEEILEFFQVGPAELFTEYSEKIEEPQEANSNVVDFRIEGLKLLAQDCGLSIEETEFNGLTAEEIKKIKDIDEILIPVLTWEEAINTINGYELDLWLSSFTRLKGSEYAKFRVLFFYQKWSPTMSPFLGKGSAFLERPGWISQLYPRLQSWENEVRTLQAEYQKDLKKGAV